MIQKKKIPTEVGRRGSTKVLTFVLQQLVDSIKNATHISGEVKKCTRNLNGYQFIRIAFVNSSESNTTITGLELVTEDHKYDLESQKRIKIVKKHDNSVLQPIKEFPFTVNAKECLTCDFCVNLEGQPAIRPGDCYLIYHVPSGKVKEKISIHECCENPYY